MTGKQRQTQLFHASIRADETEIRVSGRVLHDEELALGDTIEIVGHVTGAGIVEKFTEKGGRHLVRFFSVTVDSAKVTEQDD